MTPEQEQILAEAAATARTALAKVETMELELKELKVKEEEQFFGQGGFAASAPTADGTISVMYKGQRYRVLVDKV